MRWEASCWGWWGPDREREREREGKIIQYYDGGDPRHDAVLNRIVAEIRTAWRHRPPYWSRGSVTCYCSVRVRGSHIEYTIAAFSVSDAGRGWEFYSGDYRGVIFGAGSVSPFSIWVWGLCHQKLWNMTFISIDFGAFWQLSYQELSSSW